MTGRETRLLLAIVLGLSVALASQCAVAALLVGDTSRYLGGQHDELLQSLAEEVLSQGDLAGAASFAGPVSAPAGDEEEETPSLRLVDGVLPGPAGGCSSNTVSQSTSGGTSGAVVGDTICDITPTGPEARLPSEAKTILPTGPPFELLRPPRRISAAEDGAICEGI